MALPATAIDGAFRWHLDACLIAADGAQITAPLRFQPLPAPLPGSAALAAALAGQGRPFRIGGEGALEAGEGEFETLTGGSLGKPRRVIRSQQSWCASFAVNAGLFGIGPGTRVAVLGQLVHSLALYGAVEGLHLGARVFLLEGMRPDRQAASLAANRIGVLYATPAQLRQVVAVAPALPDLRHVIIGGAKLDPALHSAVQAIAPGAQVHEFYGASETSFITLSGPKTALHSVGNAYPGVSLRCDETGLVWVRSPYLFRGYAGGDAGSARWQGGWLTVGEMGELTADGLILKGRAGRMVTIADRNVFPEEIEAFLMAQPGVARAAVLPVADALRGNVLVAFVQGDEGEDAAILAALRRELGPTVAPKRLIWRPEWPTLASGKTDLAALQREVPKWR